MLFGMVLGLTDTVNAMQVNISIVQRKGNSESANIARLQPGHSKWTSASPLVLNVYLTIVIAFVFEVNEFARFAYMIVYMAIIIVSALGLAFGVFRNFAKQSVLSTTLLWS